MRKGLAYLDMAERCRALARQVKEPENKSILEDMAQQWETLAAQRVKDITTAGLDKPSS